MSEKESRMMKAHKRLMKEMEETRKRKATPEEIERAEKIKKAFEEGKLGYPHGEE